MVIIHLTIILMAAFGAGSNSSTQKLEYVNGSITLNFIDKKNSKLVWTGTAEGDIYDPSMVSPDLHPAVHGIID